MYESGRYRRLSGARHGGGCSRNVIFLGVFIGLSLFGSLFYLYYSTSNELETLREELTSQNNYVNKLKNEILEINVNLEKARNGENECKSSKTSIETKLNECTTEIETKKSALTELESSKIKNEESLKELQSQLDDYKAKLEKEEANMTALKELETNQDSLVIKLNNTVESLRNELASKDELIQKLKNGANITEESHFNSTQSNSFNSVLTANTEKSVYAVTTNSTDEKSNVLELPKDDTAILHAQPSGSDAEKHDINLAQLEKHSVDATTLNPENALEKLGHPAEEKDENIDEKNSDKAEEKDGDAANIPEPGQEKSITEQFLAPGKNDHNKEQTSKEMRGGLGDVIGHREPGARVKIEEANQEHQKEHESPLIDAAEKQDKEEEKIEKDENAEQEIKQSNDFN